MLLGFVNDYQYLPLMMFYDTFECLCACWSEFFLLVVAATIFFQHFPMPSQAVLAYVLSLAKYEYSFVAL